MYKLTSLIALTFSYPLLIFGQQLPAFKVNGIEVVGKTKARTEKMKKALVIFEKVMKDVDFQKELRAKIFKSDTDDDEFKNFTTEQIIQKIYAGGEEYKVDTDNTADIYWYADKKGWWQRQLDSKCSKIGYGYPSEKEIYTYTCLLDDDDLMGKLVGHIAHEWSHKIGFVHKRNTTMKES